MSAHRSTAIRRAQRMWLMKWPSAGPDVEDARVRPDQALEVRLAKGPPEDVAAPVVRQAGLVIVHQRARAGPFHPKRIPMTMRRPILRAAQLLEAPLLWPYRAWNVTGHSTMLKPCPSAGVEEVGVELEVDAGIEERQEPHQLACSGTACRWCPRR